MTPSSAGSRYPFLQDLLTLGEYFNGPESAVFESELIDTYGQETIWNAIDDGILEHRRLPFRSGRERCICWLSPKAREIAEKH